MLTIEQLYELYENRNNTEPAADKKPANRGYAALKKLNETYQSLHLSDPNEIAFAYALNDLFTQMGRLEKVKTEKKGFEAALGDKLKKFNACYDNLPDPVRTDASSEVKKTMDEVGSALTGPDKALKTAYVEEMKAMRENLMMLSDALNRLRIKNGDLVDNRTISNEKNELKEYKLDKEEREALIEVNVETFKNQMAMLMAKDQLHRTSGIKAAMDPEQVDAATAEILESDLFDNMMERLDKSDLSRDSISFVLGGAGYDNLEKLFEPPVKKVIHGSEAAPKTKNNSAIKIFKDGLSNLKENMQQSSQGLLEKKISSKEIASELLELFALRELGKKYPFKEVSREEIDQKKKDIINKDVKEKGFSLYRAVLSKVKRDEAAAERVIEGMKGDDSFDLFRSGLERDAHLERKISKVNDDPQIKK